MDTLLVRGRTIVTPKTMTRQDVLVEDGRIAAVGPRLPTPPGARAVDGDRLLVSLGWSIRVSAFEIQAGNTTWILQRARALAAQRATYDFGFYVGATTEGLSDRAALIDIAGLTMYLGSSTGSLLVAGLAAQVSHFEQYPALIAAIHAEDEEAVALVSARGERRSPLCVVLEVSRAIAN